jgi:hypothetical protein
MEIIVTALATLFLTLVAQDVKAVHIMKPYAASHHFGRFNIMESRLAFRAAKASNL